VEVTTGTEVRVTELISRTDDSGALPQFACSWDAFDPDRTLEKLPALPREVWLTAPLPGDAPVEADAEEISAADILADEPVVSPPPAPTSGVTPVSIDRLLARARVEASRSSEFFRPAAPPDQSDRVAVDPPRVIAKRWRPSLVFGGAAMAAIVLAAVGLGTARDSSARAPVSVRVEHPATLVASPTATAPSTELVTAAAMPAVSVQNLPRVATGTVSLAAVAASHRLYIDGRLAGGATATVSCGRHVVRVGAHGASRSVNVPCGQEVVVAN
jgi:hypothetical protein